MQFQQLLKRQDQHSASAKLDEIDSLALSAMEFHALDGQQRGERILFIRCFCCMNHLTLSGRT